MAALDSIGFSGLVIAAAGVSPTMTLILLHASTPTITWISMCVFPTRTYRCVWESLFSVVVDCIYAYYILAFIDTSHGLLKHTQTHIWAAPYRTEVRSSLLTPDREIMHLTNEDALRSCAYSPCDLREPATFHTVHLVEWWGTVCLPIFWHVWLRESTPHTSAPSHSLNRCHCVIRKHCHLSANFLHSQVYFADSSFAYVIAAIIQVYSVLFFILLNRLLVCSSVNLCPNPTPSSLLWPFLQGCSTLYKEKCIISFAKPLDNHSLSAWLFLYQTIFTLLLSPILYVLQGRLAGHRSCNWLVFLLFFFILFVYLPDIFRPNIVLASFSHNFDGHKPIKRLLVSSRHKHRHNYVQQF